MNKFNHQKEQFFTRYLLLRNVLVQILNFFHYKLLRNRLIIGLLGSLILVNYFITSLPPKNILLISFGLGCFLGFLLGVFSIHILKKAIKGNFYYSLVPIRQRLVYLIIALGLIKLVDAIVGPQVMAQYLALSLAVVFAISTLFALIWLISYEKRYGAVFIGGGK